MVVLAANRKKVEPMMPAKHMLFGMELRKVGISNKDRRRSLSMSSMRMATMGADGRNLKK